jgi:glyoxylase-like metal-dependent hydrolase (beta-lactamase superfamily II)
MTIGKAVINRVEEVRIPNKISYFTDDAELLAVNRYWLHPHFLDDKGGFDLVFQSWIVEVGERVILIDPCNGNGIPHSVPYFNNLDVPYIERIQAAGYRPEDVDFVVCTHLHHDHCGWNTQLRGGKWVPTFPKARYIIRQLEYDRLRARHKNLPPEDLNQGVFERSVEPVVRAGLADLVSGSHRLSPSVSVEPAAGHTLGHQMVHLASAGEQAYFTGDCFHHPIQLAEPTVQFAGGEDVEAVTAMRRRLVELSADSGAYLIAAHVPAPYAVRAFRSDRVLHFSAGVQ